MSYTWYEVPGSRQGNNNQATRQYRIENATDESDIFAFIAAEHATSTIGGLPFADFDYKEISAVDGDYDVSVTYGLPSRGGHEHTTAESEYRFNHVASGGKFMYSLATISFSGTGGSFTTAAAASVRNWKGAINIVTDDEGKKKHEGQDVQAPAEVFTLVKRGSSLDIDAAYQLVVEGLVGMVNSTTFRGRAAGSVMLVRAQGQRSGGIWTIEFGFAYIANRTNIPIGGNTVDAPVITVAAKDGMDLLWAQYEPTKDEDYPGTTMKPVAAYVERVFYRDDLNLLNLPA